MIVRDLIERLNAYTANLTETEKKVVFMRNGLYGKKYTLREASEELKTSHQTIANIEEKALEKMEDVANKLTHI